MPATIQHWCRVVSTSSSDNVLDESILGSIKKLLGLDGDYDAFDQDVTIHINSALASLSQIGVGPVAGFMINGSQETWQQLLQDNDLQMLQNVKTYIYINVKKVFDPPGASNHLAALDDVLKETTWRISVRREEAKRESIFGINGPIP